MNGFTIRAATQDDLARIHEWLTEEHEANDGASFLCNFALIGSGQTNGSLFALVRDSDSLPVAFSLGDGNVDILAVHHRMRRQGFGRYLAKHAIDHALSRDLIGLYVECAPITSKPFWLSLGFTPVQSPRRIDNLNWVALPLPHDNELPNAPKSDVVISCSSNSKDWSDPFETQGVIEDGLIQLARDFSFYNAHYYDTLLKIVLDGTELYCDKAKYLRDNGLDFDSPWIRVRSVRIG
ncbi:Acetyltransferase (GNAT) family protein [Rubripirellula lacrimiformis]|uniref:Acetyltransferase (GNAT) family protein n=1 Tax=Rubripirellula lacrimiformis TaxID=1930273 RepID=A0A517NAT9_9BACT|nr:GNAT family N-acetyltransferase [Rubripirellula lacrimiformis]QDT04255.1 Acetyltransferase (GNAT) family protein [Rubripirellula lacrimiformis]